jgi:hypothetical protein
VLGLSYGRNCCASIIVVQVFFACRSNNTHHGPLLWDILVQRWDCMHILQPGMPCMSTHHHENLKPLVSLASWYTIPALIIIYRVLNIYIYIYRLYQRKHGSYLFPHFLRNLNLWTVFMTLQVPVDCKQQSKSCNSFLSSRQVGHWLEPLAWCYTVVINAIQIWFLWVLRTEKCLCGLVLCKTL